MASPQLRTPLALSAAYFANFGALASSAPFLGLLLADAGLGARDTAEWLALLLLLRWIAIPGWTALADRARSIVPVLRFVSIAALVAFLPIALRPSIAGLLALLAVFAIFRAPFGPLLDTRTLAEQRTTGIAFGRLRAWGTAGYALGALATGACVARLGSRGVVAASCPLLACAALFAFALPSRGASDEPHETTARAWTWRDVARPRLIALFAIALLHQIGLAPYDSLFSIYLSDLGSPTSAGGAIALGAGCEFVFFVIGASLPTRWGPARLLRVACVGSAIRWAIVGATRDVGVLVAAQSLHALTFGAFYLASVAIVDEEWPAARRAIGQGLFSAWAFGVAAAIALSIAGFVERAHGLAFVFRIGAIASLVAACIPLGHARSTAKEQSMDRSF